MQINNNLTVIGAEQAPAKAKRTQPVRSDAPAPEQKTPASGIVKAPLDDEQIAQADRYQRFSREQGSNRAQVALSVYNSLEKQSQREQIQSMFGVDTYA